MLESTWDRAYLYIPFPDRVKSGMDEVSDDEFWRLIHHGAPTEEDTAAYHRQYTDTHLENIMRETNRFLDTRMQRLRAEFEAAAVRNKQIAMDQIVNEMTECTHYRYSIKLLAAASSAWCSSSIWCFLQKRFDFLSL